MCYFILPLVFDALRNDAQGLTSTARDHGIPWSLAVVVSPLQALMQDQVLSLRDKGVSAVIACNFSENVETLKSDIVCGKYQFVFVTPELLLTDRKWTDVFRSSSLSERLVALVIDEAHCVKKWLVISMLYYQHLYSYFYF